ncbi:MAG: hypothetical protein ACL7BU_16520 [Candidatus Phlomobacter fragariae]
MRLVLLKMHFIPSLMSCQNYPEHALPSQLKNEDWNDLHLKCKLGWYDLLRYRYYGDLLLIKSVTDKAIRIFNYTHRNDFYFEFDSRFYCLKWILKGI